MKVPFDIKYKPQIESGEYKVVTGDDRLVRIISWDKRIYGGRYEIVALVPTPQGDTETVQLYSTEGILIASPYNEKFKLFIVTPEPELSEFEKAIETICTNLASDIDKVDNVKKIAAELLELAKKELCNGCNANLEGYARGKLDALYEMSRVYKHEGLTIPAFCPPCHYGGECINPFRDCINCPRGAVTVGIGTTTGTSTSKVEEKK
jgi:hypothetical protein